LLALYSANTAALLRALREPYLADGAKGQAPAEMP
jgi:hypothetical protein